MAKVFLYFMVLATLSANCSAANNCTNKPQSRQKRLIMFTSDRRFAFPPATVMLVTPTLSLPFGRNLPTGYGSSLTISVPFKVSFDDLGLTSPENPFGIFPDFLFARKKRDADLPGINWAGGDREMMYQVVEDSLHNLGLDGQACLLRAICEMFQTPLVNHGFVGEMLELFFSVSRAPHAEKRLGDYLKAERAGRSTGDCSAYHLTCPQSLFTAPQPLKHTEENMDHYSGTESEEGERTWNHKDMKKEDQTTTKKTTKKQRKRCVRQRS
ncbi:uncharacterized protein LOC123520158 [Portunus trituberculatus]|uniref:uncharacterized protein LOC123520158 n=1 Tax=Portunus trituberculatus TaxID=210409 RepID=UPI001E1CD8C2|nr:uncharacterized protein LOC123520158 [Portunus trituberculatus]